MFALDLAGSGPRRRPARGVDGALDAAALEEAQAEIRVLRVSGTALELARSVRVELAAGDDAAAVFLLPEARAPGSGPAVDAVDLEGGVAEAVVGEDPAGGAGDRGGGGPGCVGGGRDGGDGCGRDGGGDRGGVNGS